MTVKDMHRICDSILTGQRDMAQMIIDGLRPQLGRSVGSNLGDAGNDGDVEGGYSEPKRREGNRTKRRDHLENELSVSSAPLPVMLAYRPYTELAEDPRTSEQTRHPRQFVQEYGHQARGRRLQPQSWSMLLPFKLQSPPGRDNL